MATHAGDCRHPHLLHLPLPSRPLSSCAVVCLCPYSSSREPGLILASQSGEVWFWNNIGAGLAGGEQYSKILLELQPNEIVNSLTRLDVRSSNTAFISAQISSASNIRYINLHWALVSVNALYLWGKYHLTARFFSRTQSSLSLSRILPSLGPHRHPKQKLGTLRLSLSAPKTNLG